MMIELLKYRRDFGNLRPKTIQRMPECPGDPLVTVS
jgi:hypothetical protein